MLPAVLFCAVAVSLIPTFCTASSTTTAPQSTDSTTVVPPQTTTAATYGIGTTTDVLTESSSSMTTYGTGTSTDYSTQTPTMSYGTGTSTDYSTQTPTMSYGTGTSTDYPTQSTTLTYSTDTSTIYPTQTTTTMPRTESSTGYPTQTTTAYGMQTSTNYPTQTTTAYGSQSSTNYPTQSTTAYGTQTSSNYPTQTTTAYVTQTSTNYPSQTTTAYGSQSSTNYPTQSTTAYGTQTSSNYPTQTTTAYGTQTSTNYPTQTTTAYGSQSSTNYPTQTTTAYGTQTSSNYPTQTTTAYGSQSSTNYPTQTTTAYGTQSSTNFPTQTTTAYGTQTSSNYPTQSTTMSYGTSTSTPYPTQTTTMLYGTGTSTNIPTQTTTTMSHPTGTSTDYPTQSTTVTYGTDTTTVSPTQTTTMMSSTYSSTDNSTETTTMTSNTSTDIPTQTTTQLYSSTEQTTSTSTVGPFMNDTTNTTDLTTGTSSLQPSQTTTGQTTTQTSTAAPTTAVPTTAAPTTQQPTTTPVPTTSAVATTTTPAVPTNDNFTYGSKAGDDFFEGDDSYRIVYCNPPIPVGSITQVQYFYISTNGNIGLNKAFAWWWWHYYFRYSMTDPVLAVYWSDLDTKGVGKVHYHVYDSDQNTMDLTVQSTAIRLIKKNYPKAVEFDPTWILVVTWEKMDFYGYWWWYWSPYYSTETFTFQCIIASDRLNTYVINNYMDINLQRRYWYYVALGYRNGPFNVDLHVNPFMKQSWWQRRKTIFRVGNLPGNIKGGSDGQWLYRLTTGASKVPADELACYRWYVRNRFNFWTYNFLITQPDFVCPCWENMILFRYDFRWRYHRSVWMWGYYRLTCYASLSFNYPHSAECCYRYGRYVRWVGWYGYGLFFENSPFYNRQLYYQNDELPVQQCFKTKHYDWIREVRPRSFCYTRSPFRIAWTFGDPHIKTLDGKQYTFNGRGEYTMLKVENENKTFVLQARTDLALTADGNATEATVFTGFAAKDHSNATLQVELSDDRSSLVIFGNGADRTNQFTTNANFSSTEANLVLGRENDTLEAYFPAAAITVKITVGVRLLTVVTIAPDDIKGQTKGLLGNFDDDPSNDFVKPDGTIITRNVSQREVYYEFGQLWSITAQESVFNYTSGKSAADYSFPNFEPLFVDEVEAGKLANATAQCGGASASQACIFDLLATGDEELASQSGSNDAQGDSDQSSISNEVPTISGNTTVYVTVNESVTLRYNATDDGAVNVTFLDEPPVNFAYNTTQSGETVVIWTPADTSEVNISVTALDSTGASASPIDTVIVLCSGCSGHGQCNNSDTVSTDNPNFFYAKCECDTEWTGDNCDQDFDACAEQPCDPDRNCTDLDPFQHNQMGVGYNCSGCPLGYKDNDTKCVDIDECDERTHTCDQECVNNEGSYTCACYDTYRMLNSVCVDIDECAEQTAGCEQVCENTPGNFTCSCVFGYDLRADLKTCLLVADVCSLNSLNCSYACDNSTGAWQCICRNGYQIGSDGYTCVDKDECALGVCTQDCVNSVGSYTCSCYSGYTLTEDGTSCESCSVPYWGANCANVCSCGTGVDTCDPIQGCVCQEGYEGSDCNDDIDECTVDPGTCSSDMICVNLDGSYECNCYSGFLKNNGLCEDIDECSDPLLQTCPTESTCENNQGSFTCSCNSGYNQNGTHSCIDIDECATGVHNCEQICENVGGSYNCKCEFGFSLNSDRATCTKVSDPCAAYGNLTCDYACKLNGTSVACFCQSGFQLATDGEQCLDIDECSDSALNLCSVEDSCVNLNGSFYCACDTGYKLENDGITCTICDEYHYGINCSQNCDCGPGAERCDHVAGCICRSGWAGSKCSADKDECQSSPSPCSGANTECLNSPGSYICACKTGYQQVSGTSDCQDIDECAGVTPCGQICTNTPGSYACSCRTGFRLVNGTTCTDVNECSLATQYCDQDCINTIGGYKCSCRDGYVLNTTTRNTCYAKTECSAGNTCNQTCAVTSTLQEYCSCTFGYRLSNDNETCDNIDECSEIKPCVSGTCTDKSPGFQCSCAIGQILDVDGITCVDCTDWTYGTDCNQNCTCVRENTVSCNNTNGKCTCVSGWEGTDCGTNINECNDTTLYSCPANSNCLDTNGSYICRCDAGFAFAGGVCAACDSKTFGLDCAQQCTCDIQNTVDCDDVSGSCTCKSGWSGTNCTSDVDECLTTTCGNNSHCVNTVGSYRCVCDAGWTGTGGNCDQDIDECLIPPPICNNHGNCSNFPGTYNCTCDKGWNGTNCEFGNCFIDRTICQGNTECVYNGTNTTCQCLPGYDATCTSQDNTLQRMTITVTLDITLANSTLSDNTSDEYADVFQKVRTALDEYYTWRLGSYYLGIILLQVRIGSVVADHQLISTSSDSSASAVIAALRDLTSGNANITYDGSLVNITGVESNGVAITSDQSDCELFQLFRSCPSGYQCVSSGGATSCQPMAEEDKSNLPLIIGVSVGASVLVIAIVLTIVIYQCHHKKGRFSTKKRVSLSNIIAKRTASVHSVDFGDDLMKKENSGVDNFSTGKPGSASKGKGQATNINVQPESSSKNGANLDY